VCFAGVIDIPMAEAEVEGKYRVSSATSHGTAFTKRGKQLYQAVCS